jgi:hypothetical protein
MAVLSGGDFQLEVRTATGPDVYTVVGDMHTFSEDTRRGISNFPVFDKAMPYRKVGKPEYSFSVDGYDNPADAGQTALNAASDAGTEIRVRVTRDGAAGFTQDVLVTSSRMSAEADEESLQGRTYEFTGTTARVAIP